MSTVNERRVSSSAVICLPWRPFWACSTLRAELRKDNGVYLPEDPRSAPGVHIAAWRDTLSGYFGMSLSLRDVGWLTHERRRPVLVPPGHVLIVCVTDVANGESVRLTNSGAVSGEEDSAVLHTGDVVLVKRAEEASARLRAREDVRFSAGFFVCLCEGWGNPSCAYDSCVWSDSSESDWDHSADADSDSNSDSDSDSDTGSDERDFVEGDSSDYLDDWSE